MVGCHRCGKEYGCCEDGSRAKTSNATEHMSRRATTTVLHSRCVRLGFSRLKQPGTLTLVPHPVKSPPNTTCKIVLSSHSTFGYLGTTVGSSLTTKAEARAVPAKNHVVELFVVTSFLGFKSSRRRNPDAPRIAPASNSKIVVARCRRIAPAVV